MDADLTNAIKNLDYISIFKWFLGHSWHTLFSTTSYTEYEGSLIKSNTESIATTTKPSIIKMGQLWGASLQVGYTEGLTGCQTNINPPMGCANKPIICQLASRRATHVCVCCEINHNNDTYAIPIQLNA